MFLRTGFSREDRLFSTYSLSRSPPTSSATQTPSLFKSPLQWWYCFLAHYIATKEEQEHKNNSLHRKCLLFTINLSNVLCCSSTCCIFPFLPWSDVWILYYTLAGTFVVVVLAALSHMVITKRSWMCHFVATWWHQLLTCIGFWSFGGLVRSSTFVLLPFLAPHVWFLTNTGGLAGPGCMFGIACLVVAARLVVDLALGTGALTPLVIRIPESGMTVAAALIAIIASGIAFCSAAHMLRRMQQRAEALENDMNEARGVAQMLVNWDLDALPEASGDNDVVDLMVQVAEKLKLYRPYLPAHLFTPGSEDDVEDVEDIQELAMNAPKSSGAIGGAAPRAHVQRTSTSDRPELLSLTKATVHRPLAPHNGTLLRARISITKESLRSVSGDVVQRVANALARVVQDAARETKGLLQTMTHDHCLILWNVDSKCATHVLQGLTAAVMIRNRFTQHCTDEGEEGFAISIGLWSGAFVSGTLSLGDMTSHVCLGQGPDQALALQEYAAMFGRHIMCNNRVFDATKLAPKHRLVPVDVLSFGSGDTRGDIVYECVCEFETDTEEWMYQISVNRSAPDDHLRRLMQQVQQGMIANRDEFDSEVSGLRAAGEPIVSQVACALGAITRHHLTAGRYCRNLCPVWPLEPCFGPAARHVPTWPQFVHGS